ncbi:MAG TPA: type II secretion system F family protein [Bryobacteraceae bacterium]|nr:type II secretion system F family protein [Bryobacteraceae bacterium]
MHVTAILLFLVLLGLSLLGSGVALRALEARRRKRVASAIQTIAAASRTAPQAKVVIRPGDQSPTLAKKILQGLNLISPLETRLRQSGLDWTVERLLLTMLAAAAAGAVAGHRFPALLDAGTTSIALGGLLGLLPWFYVSHKRKRRFLKLEEQLPEAMDFLARSMRAGHALPVSLEMLATEGADPLRAEFAILFNEQHLGESLSVALTHLAERVPLVDTRFFVSAVLLQRETGGNLSEILTRLAAVIRERFRLKGQVRAASAHGRITAGVLTLLPILTVAGLRVVAPDYLLSMSRDPLGRYMLTAAVIALLAGYFIMRKIIDIKI